MIGRSSRLVPAIPRSAFVGYRFPSEIIVLAISWYLRYGLSYRDVEELLAERGIEVDHVTVYRWVQRFTLLLAGAARPCRHAVNSSPAATSSKRAFRPTTACGTWSRRREALLHHTSPPWRRSRFKAAGM